MNSNPLRVVLVDDNPDDRLLVRRELRRAFPDCSFDEVTDATEFQCLLQRERPGLLITDYQLLWTDGLTVLRDAKTKWPECPVIMFTGTGSEEIAVEAMKAGLDDYVLKSPKHYARLCSAVQVTLKLDRQRQQLKEAENRYTLLFNSVPIGLFRATPAGIICDANPALVEMLGYPNRDALLTVPQPDLFLEPAKYQQWAELLDRHGVLCDYQAELRCYNQNVRWVRQSARAVRGPNQQPIFYEGSIEDITEQKKTEQEREQLILELQDALAKIKTLSGLLPICSSCKKIRDDKGYWNQIEVYIETHSDAEFTHSFCPECVQRLYPEVLEALAK